MYLVIVYATKNNFHLRNNSIVRKVIFFVCGPNSIIRGRNTLSTFVCQGFICVKRIVYMYICIHISIPDQHLWMTDRPHFFKYE